MSEEFEAWYAKAYSKPVGDYEQLRKDMCETAWQASAAATEAKYPDVIRFKDPLALYTVGPGGRVEIPNNKGWPVFIHGSFFNISPKPMHLAIRNDSLIWKILGE